MPNEEGQLPCIICQNGDVYSNIVCDDCELNIDFRRDLHGSMERLVFMNNDIVGSVPGDIVDKIKYEVDKIYNQLNNLKIEGKERCK